MTVPTFGVMAKFCVKKLRRQLVVMVNVTMRGFAGFWLYVTLP